MDAEQAELIGDKVISLFPLVRRKLLPHRAAHSHVPVHNLWYAVLGIMMHSGVLPMSELGRRLGISKPHMTSLIDVMVNEGLVKRQPDKKDRRIINIIITKKGCAFLHNSRKMLKENLKKNLSSLSSSDCELLANSLENIRKILLKLDEKQK
jgi:DNA-binding MarR family transcriptional regulator